MAMVRKMVGGKKRKGGIFGRVRRMMDEQRARQQGERQDPEPARGGRTRRPAGGDSMLSRKKERSLMKQRLGS